MQTLKKEISIRKLTKDSPEDLKACVRSVAALADEIWHEHFTPIIGAEQVDYMLSKFQSEDGIYADIKNGDFIYFLAEDTKRREPVAYCGVRVNEDYLLLSKLYILSGYRGEGIGRKLFDEVVALCGQVYGFKTIRLTVNKNNTGPIDVYKKIGFTVIDSVKTDIGGGFYMDDYIMEFSLSV